MTKIVTLSEAASIGMHSVVVLARAKKLLSVQDIAQVTKDSKHHISKVMLELSKQGIVSSVRGPKGGFQLAKPPSEISLLEIYEIIEGKIEHTDCPAGKEHCPFGFCILDNVTDKMSMDFYNYLKNKTLDRFV